MPKRAGRVLLVEDYPCIAHALISFLSERGLVVEEPEAFTLDAVLTKTAQFGPDAVLLDFWLGDGHCMDMIAPLAATGTRVTIFTGMENRTVIGECLDLGAVGFISKNQLADSMVEAIEKAVRGEDILTADAREELIEEARASQALERRLFEPFALLSEREDEVLRLVISGLSAEDIARREIIAISTVRSHIRAITEKLGVDSQLKAVALAHERGWPPILPKDWRSDPSLRPRRPRSGASPDSAST